MRTLLFISLCATLVGCTDDETPVFGSGAFRFHDLNVISRSCSEADHPRIIAGELGGRPIPGSAGKPSATACIDDQGQYRYFSYTPTAAGDDVLVSYDCQYRRFQLEYYYDPIAGQGADRSFEYTYTLDYATDALKIDVQQPASATGFQIEPAADRTQVSQTLTHHIYELGPKAAGDVVSFRIRYNNSAGVLSGEVQLVQNVADGKAIPQSLLVVDTVNPSSLRWDGKTVRSNQARGAADLTMLIVVERPCYLHGARPVIQVSDWSPPIPGQTVRLTVDNEIHGSPVSLCCAKRPALNRKRSKLVQSNCLLNYSAATVQAE